MFDHKAWQRKFRATPGLNDADWVRIESLPSNTYRCIGVHHLTGQENAGKHNVFIDVLDEAGNRLSVPVLWTWEGRRPEELAPPLRSDDKPENEPGCNVSLVPAQIVSVWVEGASDVVRGLTTARPDDATGNTWGHHSYYVVFARGVHPTPPQPPPDQPQPPAPLPEDISAIYRAAVDLSQLLVDMGNILWNRIIVPLEQHGIQVSSHGDSSSDS